ncbi:MAG: tRNA 2-thiouridine(34) synthase MnmA [Bacilli bacterium]|nr:tRNA 2-thiouridine(34) synthase MnmA [Bacilli bacterium]MDD4831417.1 tRNA 2-thiouridine(34) synthase MnmA [Bacilli bacterium]
MKKVVVGMSGGVDSSVAAYLLKEQGYEVIGLFMRNWDSLINNDIMGNPTIENDICTQEEDYNDALYVCNQLDIPLHRVDFVKEYWDYVFTYFLDELKKGRTPNPDVMCNKYIKFDYFIKEAKRLGADYVATGHYARIIDGTLYKGIDTNKDQSYFLCELTKKQLENVLFPVGELNKDEVRDIAIKLNLKTAKKKDSTGICFIGERNFKNFLKNYLPTKEGDIVNIENKKVLGKHIGLMYYTIGQRRGLNIGGYKERLYVVGKDLNKNILYVCYGDDNEYLYSDEALIEDFNLMSDKKVDKCNAKFRYRQKDNVVNIEYLKDKEIIVKYNNIKAVTPGQICVLYDGDECIGGGIIKEVRKNGNKLWYL